MTRPNGSMLRTGCPVTRSNTVTEAASADVPTAVVVVIVRVRAPASTAESNVVTAVAGPPTSGAVPGAHVIVRRNKSPVVVS